MTVINQLRTGTTVGLEFTQSETIRKAVVGLRHAGPLGSGTTFDVLNPAKRIFVYDKDIQVLGETLAVVESYHSGM